MLPPYGVCYFVAAVCELISHLIKHSHSEQSQHTAIHFVIVTVRTNGSTPILILCDRFFCRIHIGRLHYAQMESQR